VGLGRVLTARGEAAEAEPLLRKALSIRLGSLPPGHGQVAEARSALGASLVALKRHEEAERLLHDAFVVQRAQGRKPPLRATATQLVRLYESTGRPERAEPYRALAR
jgi:hypothetical protein